MKEYEQDPFSQFEFVRMGLLMQVRSPRRLQGSTSYYQITDTCGTLAFQVLLAAQVSHVFISHYVRAD